MDGNNVVVAGNDFSLEFDGRGHICGIRFRERVLEFPVVCTTYQVAGDACQTAPIAGDGDLSYQLHSANYSATLSVSPGKEITFEIRPGRGEDEQRVGFSLFLPSEAVLHLAEHRNIGRRIDAQMPVGESYSCTLQYNFLLVRVGDMWIRLRTNHSRHRTADIQIVRHPKQFGITYLWTTDTNVCLAVFASMQEAVDDYESWMEEAFEIRKLTDAARTLPDWVQNVRLIITADMLRSNWEISHDYTDVLRLARELRKTGCKKDTLLYIPGWQGAYDSTHPTYRPRPELGGADGFRSMVDGIHECGYRVMIHTTGWGIDPYHPDIDSLEHLVLRDEDGDYRGWQLSHKWYPATKPLMFRTGRIPLNAPSAVRSFAFETAEIPDWCEALISVGGISTRKGRVRLVVGRRSIASLPGWFSGHSVYDYPYPLLLEPGKNEIRVEMVGETEPRWDEAWYRIRYCFRPVSPYSSWTWPILMADMSHPEYVNIFVDSVSEVVREYGIDAVHVDATFVGPSDVASRPEVLLYRLRECLPGVAICGEAMGSFEAMGYWALSQAATQSLADKTGVGRPPREQGSLPVKEGLGELYGWLDKESPVCGFAKDYFHSYPHLCAANAFVPVGKVCNIFPPRRIPRTSEAQWRVLRDARRMDYIPGIRVNYREYGLDHETKEAILELTR